MSKEAMKLALEALEGVADWVNVRTKEHPWDQFQRVAPAITALREALANEALERMAENARELGLDYDTPAQQTIHCKHRRENNGVCPHHNLHCGWPKCNEPEQPAQQEPSELEIWKVRALQAEGIVRKFMAQPKQEPIAWRDHVEQRLLTWRQSFVNKSGDQLALDDFMDKRSLDDLIDFVCSEYTSPPAQRPWVGLTEQEALDCFSPNPATHSKNVEAKLRSKNENSN